MSAIGKFFGGMSITGYVITAFITVILTLAVSVGYLNHVNNKLTKELAVSEHAILTLVDVNQQNRKSIDELELLATECASKRSAAEKAAKEANLELKLRALELKQRMEGAKHEIEKVPDDCTCVVPPRATELLIEAACRANRDTNCP